MRSIIKMHFFKLKNLYIVEYFHLKYTLYADAVRQKAIAKDEEEEVYFPFLFQQVQSRKMPTL